MLQEGHGPCLGKAVVMCRDTCMMAPYLGRAQCHLDQLPDMFEGCCRVATAGIDGHASVKWADELQPCCKLAIYILEVDATPLQCGSRCWR